MSRFFCSATPLLDGSLTNQIDSFQSTEPASHRSRFLFFRPRFFCSFFRETQKLGEQVQSAQGNEVDHRISGRLQFSNGKLGKFPTDRHSIPSADAPGTRTVSDCPFRRPRIPAPDARHCEFFTKKNRCWPTRRDTYCKKSAANPKKTTRRDQTSVRFKEEQKKGWKMIFFLQRGTARREVEECGLS